MQKQISTSCKNCPLATPNGICDMQRNMEKTKSCVEGVLARTQRAIIAYGQRKYDEQRQDEARKVIWDCLQDLALYTGKSVFFPIIDRVSFRLKEQILISPDEETEKLIDYAKTLFDAEMINIKEAIHG